MRFLHSIVAAGLGALLSATPIQASIEQSALTDIWQNSGVPRILNILSAPVVQPYKPAAVTVPDETSWIDLRHERSRTFTAGKLCDVSLMGEPVSCRPFISLEVSFAYDLSDEFLINETGKPIEVDTSVVYVLENGKLVEGQVLVSTPAMVH